MRDRKKFGLLFNGKYLRDDTQSCKDAGLKKTGEILCVQPSDELPSKKGHASEIPQYLCFIFRIESLRPNYDAQHRRTTSTGCWTPPTLANAYTTIARTFWRWQGGRVTAISASDAALSETHQIADTASFFLARSRYSTSARRSLRRMGEECFRLRQRMATYNL